jgi:hypothetical protein
VSELVSWETGIATNATECEPEFASLWNGLVGAWVPALGPTGNTLYDVGPYANHGTLTGVGFVSPWVESPYGGGIGFPLRTENNQILCGNSPSIRPATLPISVLIVYSPSQVALNASVWRNDNVTNNSGVFIIQTVNGFWLNFGDNTGTAATGRRTLVGATNPVVGKWYTIVCIVRGADDMSLYLNGADDGESYSGTGGAMAYGAGQCSIGGKYTSNIYCQGAVSCAMVWDVALPDAQARMVTNDPTGLLRLRRDLYYDPPLRALIETRRFNPNWTPATNPGVM